MVNWCTLYIGSAGHGNGKGKHKSANGKLETREDIVDAQKYFNSKHTDTNKIYCYGSMNYEGLVGSASDCLGTIKDFLENCKQNDNCPIIYYTGHGDAKGDWCFPKGTISFQEIYDVLPSAFKTPVLICDCCHSGAWVWLGKEKNMHVIAASHQDELAWNRAFAKAVFNGDADAKNTLRNSSKAIANKKIGQTEVCYFTGFNASGNSSWLEP